MTDSASTTNNGAVTGEDWKHYGEHEHSLHEYYKSFREKATDVVIMDITKSGDTVETTRETRFDNAEALFAFLKIPPAANVKLRYLGCNQLSSDSLRVIGSTYKVHFEFWNWVLSDEAADGYWMHSHAGGTILCFDLAVVEEYTASGDVPSALLYGGRFKQLSSIHNFGNTPDVPQTKTKQLVQTNRRATGYMTSLTYNTPVFILFSENIPQMRFEDIQSPVEIPCMHNIANHVPSTSVDGVLAGLQQLSQRRMQELAEDPFAMIVFLESRAVSSWFSFFLKVARELESTDALITLETDDEILFKKAAYIRRDVLLALDRFYRQFEAHEGFLMYVVNGTKPAWCPKLVPQELKDQIKSIQVLKMRIDQLKERANGILNLIFNNINIRQARLSIRQADRTMEMSNLQRYDTYLSYQQGESMRRISILATIFLPLSLSTGFFGMNAREINASMIPLWVFAPVAIISTLVVVVIAFFMARQKTDQYRKALLDPESTASIGLSQLEAARLGIGSRSNASMAMNGTQQRQLADLPSLVDPRYLDPMSPQGRRLSSVPTLTGALSLSPPEKQRV